MSYPINPEIELMSKTMDSYLPQTYGKTFEQKVWTTISQQKRSISRRNFWTELSQKGPSKKTTEATADLVGNKMTDEITKAAYKNAREDESKSTTLAQTDETSMQKMEIQKEKYMSPQKK